MKSEIMKRLIKKSGIIGPESKSPLRNDKMLTSLSELNFSFSLVQSRDEINDCNTFGRCPLITDVVTDCLHPPGSLQAKEQDILFEEHLSLLAMASSALIGSHWGENDASI